MEVKAVQCPQCKDLIFSRTRDDFRTCSCQTSYIEGGRSFLKYGFTDPAVKAFRTLKPEVVLVDATEEELYEDWAHKTNKYGLIKAG